MAEAELRNMIMNFRVSDLQVLLGFAGRNKTGKKQELQYRAMEMLKLKSPAIEMKIRELHNRRYHHQIGRPAGYEVPERTHSERPPTHHYDPQHMNNNYNPRYNPNVRPAPQHHQMPSSSYPSPSKAYAPVANTNSHMRYGNSCANVKFKNLTFYDICYCLVQPNSLVADVSERLQESSFYFTLTPPQAKEVATSRRSNGIHACQILLRFCLLDATCEQEDCFPQNASVKVNNKVVPLPNPIPTNRPGVEPKRPPRPVNITPYSKLSPTVTNVVTVTWASTYGRSFAVALFVARHLTPEILVDQLKNNGLRNPEYTTMMIKEKLQQGQDSDIATTSLRGSLVCPLGKIRMELPCRANTCTHLQCFEALLYIQMNEKKPKWICPVCDKPAPLRALIIDGLFIEIAKKVPLDCTEVEFYEDGSWKPVEPVKENKDAKKAAEKKKAKKSVEVVDILSDSDSEEVWSYDLDPQTVKGGNEENGSPNPLSPSSFFPTPSLLIPPDTYTQAFANSLQMTTDGQNEANNSVCILPDLISNTDTSMPSTSSSSPGLSSTPFPQLPFLSDQYYPGTLNDQTSLNGSQGQTAYNNFDFLSLLQIPTDEPQKGKENERSTPDVISLD